MDLGIYVIQGACMAAGGLAPTSVSARQLPKLRPDRFVDVEETLEWTMDFPGGERCVGRTSYNESANRFRAEGGKRWFELEPAFTSSDLAGATHGGPLQFAPSLSRPDRWMPLRGASSRIANQLSAARWVAGIWLSSSPSTER